MERMIYNIYCDESCHLQNDKADLMVLGAVTCPEKLKKKIYSEIRAIKERHGISTWTETKWTKISPAKIDLYLDLINYFVKNRHLNFRGVVATGKKSLDHDLYNQGSYDVWYYKMYYVLLDPMIIPPEEYRVFIDIKDTRGGPKIKTLHEVLCNRIYDFRQDIIIDIRQIQSEESEVMQLTDLLIGALSYFHRGLHLVEGANSGKKTIIEHITKSLKIDLSKSTSKFAHKFNVFIWRPRGCY